MIRRRSHRPVPSSIDEALTAIRERGYEPWIVDLPRDRDRFEGMHALPQLQWVVKGGMTLRVDDKEVELAEGDLVETSPGTRSEVMDAHGNARLVCATSVDAAI